MVKENSVKFELMSPINPADELTLNITEGDTVLALVQNVCEDNAVYTTQLLNKRELSPYIRIAYNGDIVDNEECKNIKVSNGDNIIVISSVRGG